MGDDLNQTQRLLKALANQLLPKSDSNSNGSSLPKLRSISLKGEIKAYDLYARHYTALEDSDCSSKTVSDLTNSVQTANLAVCLWNKHGRVSENEDPELRDMAGEVQLQIFSAANWLRRYIYERVVVNSWYDGKEKQEARDTTEKLRVLGENICERLRGTPGFDYTKEWEDKKAELEGNSESQKLARSSRERLVRELQERINHIGAAIEKLQFYIREIEDARSELPIDHQSRSVIQRAREFVTWKKYVVDEADDVSNLSASQKASAASMKDSLKTLANELESVDKRGTAPPWRTAGGGFLGPFGIRPVVDPQAKRAVPFITTNFKTIFPNGPPTESVLAQNKINGAYIVDEKYGERYKNLPRVDGKLVGTLSPFFKITIPSTDDTFALIRIPENAKYFTWAYPIIDTKTNGEDFFRDSQEKTVKDYDYFLLFGGYIYYDKDQNFIRANALLPYGSQLQFSCPYPLDQRIYDEIEAAGRFAKITLSFLDATHFAWILPGEFSDPKVYGKYCLPKRHPGAFAYKYADSRQNNYFVLAAVETISGKKTS